MFISRLFFCSFQKEKISQKHHFLDLKVQCWDVISFLVIWSLQSISLFWTSSINVTWEHVRNENSQAPPQVN
jgi:hypothetical protein